MSYFFKTKKKTLIRTQHIASNSLKKKTVVLSHGSVCYAGIMLATRLTYLGPKIQNMQPHKSLPRPFPKNNPHYQILYFGDITLNSWINENVSTLTLGPLSFMFPILIFTQTFKVGCLSFRCEPQMVPLDILSLENLTCTQGLVIF